MNNTRLKDIREENEYTQLNIGKELLVSRSTVASWKNDLASIPLIKLIQFANHFNISIDYTLRLTNDKYDK